MTRLRVGVLGATGFLGGEMVRLLAGHPHVALTVLGSAGHAGQWLSAVRPGLVGAADGLLENLDADTLAERCDLVVLGLPHGASGTWGRALRQRGLRVLDLGSDFRLRDAEAHARWYGRPPTAPELLGEATYALPELTGGPAADAALVANPGCFATALLLAVAPLGVGPDVHVVVAGATGSSGSGIAPAEGVHHSTRGTDYRAYKPLTHQHLGEVLQLLADRGGTPRLGFVPHSAPMVRGIHVTVVLPRAACPDAADRLARAYAGCPLVSVDDGPVRLGGVVGTCRAALGVAEDADHVVIFSAIDNLLKGGSGQAVQNLNLWMGWPETLGLPLIAAWP